VGQELLGIRSAGAGDPADWIFCTTEAWSSRRNNWWIDENDAQPSEEVCARAQQTLSWCVLIVYYWGPFKTRFLPYGKSHGYPYGKSYGYPYGIARGGGGGGTSYITYGKN
jgi:hypothetical protein